MMTMEKFELTREKLKACLPHAKDSNIGLYFRPLQQALEKYEINTPKRVAAFLAQIAHESGSLRYVEEIASGEAYDTGKLAKALGNTPEKDGDGQKFKGRGLIQITGYGNYHAVGEALQYDFVKYPEDLAKPGAATFSAAWYWKSRGLNELADVDDFEKITRRINGGTNGKEDRLRHWEICKAALM